MSSFKVVIAGSAETGKTSLLFQLTNKNFKDQKPTIGMEFKSYSLTSNGEDKKIQIWDTSGQERFRNATKAYFRNALGAVLVFSLIDRQSFTDLTTWIKDFHSLCTENAYIVLVGCKSDLESDRLVTRSEAQHFADKYKIKYFEASSKTGFNVESVFQDLIDGICDGIKKGNIVTNKENIQETVKEENKYETVKEEEEEEDDNIYSLSFNNLYDFPFDKYEKDFTFILNGQRYKTSRFVADILSPNIREMHLSDPTIDEFTINTETISIGEKEGEKYFLNF